MRRSGGKALKGGVWVNMTAEETLGKDTTAERRPLPELENATAGTKVTAVNVIMHDLATCDQSIGALGKGQGLRDIEAAGKAGRKGGRNQRKAAKRTAGAALWGEVVRGGKDLGKLSKPDLEGLVECKKPKLGMGAKKNKPELKLAPREQFAAKLAGPATTASGSDSGGDGGSGPARMGDGMGDGMG